jgi:PAS domain S-box-containing protein
MTGFEKEEAIGRNCRFLQGIETEPHVLEAMRKSLQKKESFTAVIRNYRKNGELFYNELSISPLFDESNTLSHYVGIQKDVTVEVLLKQQREDFVATLLHDVKSPMAGANRLLEHCLTGEPSAESMKTCIRLLAESNRDILKLIHNAIDCYRAEDGALTVVRTEFCLNRLLADCARMLQATADHKGVRMFLGTEPVNICADEHLCTRLFANLLENAIKNSPGGGIVEVLVNEKQNCVEVEFSNTGKQIPANLKTTLFKKYSTGNRTTGSGLGLFLSKTILQNHGGSLEVDSSDKLTTFVATFPRTGDIHTSAA